MIISIARIVRLTGIIVMLGACARTGHDAADSASTRVSAASTDSDTNVSGGTIPAGYIGRTDRADAPIAGARYVVSGQRWDVTTGPAHILYSLKDTATTNYVASATFEQLDAPAHPEAFGIFIGGIHLDRPTQAYVYFLVRGTGEMLIRYRDGASTRDTVSWTPSPLIPRQDAAGQATYDIAVDVKPDSVRFIVNTKQVASLRNVNLQSAGIAGLRINHNLHLRVSPLSISRE